MQDHDWSQFRLRIPVKADVATIYRCWSTQQGLESWFLRKAAFSKADGTPRDPGSFVEEDDSYEWLWHGWSDDVVEKGKVLTLNGKDSLCFSFGKAGDVEVNIKEEQGQTIVELHQYNIPTDQVSQAYYHMGCTKGWLFYLTNLKSILEGGLDLRNRNVELKDVINS